MFTRGLRATLHTSCDEKAGATQSTAKHTRPARPLDPSDALAHLQDFVMSLHSGDQTWKRYKEAIQAQEVQAAELNIRRSALQDQIHSMEADTKALRVSSLVIQTERSDRMADLVTLQDNLANTYVSVQVWTILRCLRPFLRSHVAHETSLTTHDGTETIRQGYVAWEHQPRPQYCEEDLVQVFWILGPRAMLMRDTGCISLCRESLPSCTPFQPPFHSHVRSRVLGMVSKLDRGLGTWLGSSDSGRSELDY